ncbi:hypothetical protein KAS08_05485 [Candidatus Pacearchaeota archaeon]|nr:hypothetical protein [Candidatus Pacearchaeota archaeon]
MKKLCFIIIGAILFNFISLASVSALSISIYVPEKYTDIIAGDRLYFEIGVEYPENPRRKDLRLEYEILTLEEEVIAQSKGLKAIKTQASFVESIIVPESAMSKMHLIRVKIGDYGDLKEEVSASFFIINNSASQIKLYLFITIGAVIIIGILIIFSLLIKKK